MSKDRIDERGGCATAIPATRLQVVDALRGLALFGVFWANLLIFSGIDYLSDEQRVTAFGGRADALAFVAERFFIENKFMGLFSFLFGISFWLFLNRVRDRVTSPVALFHRRILWLFVIGAIHGWLFWCFDILRFYALWAVLLPLFTRTPPRRLLLAALTACVLIPALVSSASVLWSRPGSDAGSYDAMALAAFSTGTYRQFLAANWKYDWYLTLDIGQIAYQVGVFGRLLLGLYAARTLDLARPGANDGLLRKVLIFGTAAGVMGNAIFAGQLLPSAHEHAALAFVRRLLVEAGHLGFTLAYAAALVLSFNAGWTKAIAWLAPVGQMALTWYLFQTLFGIWMFYGFPRGPALMGKMGPASMVLLAVVGFTVQVMLARAWLHRFRFGPAEWCWRSLTYGRVQPLLLRSG